MSKEADKTAVDEAGKAERRQRKRRSGLRIPSDNVPRASDSEISAPVPEDPKLAVSVAVAFGGGDNGAADPNDAAAPDDDEQELEVDAIEADDEDDDEFAEYAPRAIEDEFDDPSQVEGIPLPREDDLTGPEVMIEPPTRVDPEVSSEPDAEESPAVGLSALADDDEVELPSGEKSGDSVEIAFDDEEVASEARAVGQAEAAPRPAPTRAQTMALSEEDLEEVMEEIGDAASQRASAAAEADLDERKTVPSMPAIDPAMVAQLEAEAAAEEAASSTGAEDQGDESTAAPAAPAAAQDPGDSGEIISDDLIEEVDEYAEPASRASDATPPPPPMPTELPSPESPPVSEPATNGDATPPPPAPPAARAEESRPPAPPPAKPKPPPAPKSARPAAPGKQRRRRGKPWFEDIFEEDYLRTLPFLTPQATQAEAQFVEESLSVDPGAQLLDVGCGYGRHAMELAARGYHVVALDASLPLLLRGADEAQRRGLDINFVHGDMRELTFDAQFDGAYCLFSTFGYFDDETNKKAAQNIARALKPGARLVVEVLNRDYLIADLPSRVWWEGDGCVVLEEVDFNYFSSRIISNRSVVFDDGRQLEQEISIRSYSLHEFGKLLHAAGFRVVEISGSMVTRGRFFGSQSRDIIVVAERRSSAEPK